MSDWRTIDSAPKDGTEVLITDGVDYAVAAWLGYADFPHWRDMGDMGWAGQEGGIPTHWQPLVPP